MSNGSGLPKGGIPSWQRQENKPTAQIPEQPTPTTSQTPTDNTEPHDLPASKPPETVEKPPVEATIPAPSSQSDLLLKALKFLQDDNIRDSPPAEKLAFLEGKGLDEESMKSIRALLSTNTAPATEPVSAEQSREVAPIITYPEFLMHSTKPPPIITTQRLLNTAYAATGAAAMFYGISEYLVKPMVESLTSARHDLHEHTRTKMNEFNEKLAGIVSVDPATKQAAILPQFPDVQDAASEDSDPTELFHRDFGTQTTPDIDIKAKDAASESSSNEVQGQDAIAAQAEKIERMRALTTDLCASHLAGEGQNHEEISTVIRVLNEYLDGMAYPSSTSSYGVYGSVMDLTGDGKKKDEDQISKIKAEIRGIKGVFLSARNFPSTGPGSVGRPTAA